MTRPVSQVPPTHGWAGRVRGTPEYMAHETVAEATDCRRSAGYGFAATSVRVITGNPRRQSPRDPETRAAGTPGMSVG